MPLLQQPNIVLALFDTLGASELDKHLSDLPALTKLKNKSRTFLNAYTPNPQAGPARASVFSGLDPVVHGVWTDGVALPGHEQTFVQRLAAGGYSTWLAGRRQLSGASHWTTEPTRRGEFVQLEWAHGPLHRSRQNSYLQWLQSTAGSAYAKVFPTQADPDNTRATATQLSAINQLEDNLSFNVWVGKQICRMISSRELTRPFFAMAGFVVGESLGAEPTDSNVTECVNSAAVQQADKALGRILNSLSDNDIQNDTVVIVASARGHADNGTHLLPESALKVPLLIHAPDTDFGVVSELVSTIDIAPTIIDMARIPPVNRMQGQSLAGHITSRDWVLSRVRCPKHGWQSSLRSAKYKIVVTHNSGAESDLPRCQLFHLTADPAEQVDLAGNGDHAATLENLIDTMIDARCALEDRTEPRIANF